MIKPTLLTLVLAGVLAAPIATLAQEPKPDRPPGERPGRGGARINPVERLKNLKERLGLTEEQTAKIKDIFEKYRGEIGKLRDDSSLKPEDRRPKVQELRKAEMEEMKAVLTPGQQEKLKEMRPAGGPRGKRGPGGKPEPK